MLLLCLSMLAKKACGDCVLRQRQQNSVVLQLKSSMLMEVMHHEAYKHYQITRMRFGRTTKILEKHVLGQHRISGCPGMQLSILRIFHQMLGDGAFRRQPSSGPLLHFSTGIVRTLFKRLVPTPEAPPEFEPPQQEHPGGAA